MKREHIATPKKKTGVKGVIFLKGTIETADSMGRRVKKAEKKANREKGARRGGVFTTGQVRCLLERKWGGTGKDLTVHGVLKKRGGARRAQSFGLERGA